MQNPFQHQAITAVHREKPFLLADGCVFEQVSTFFGLKLRQLIGKVRVLSCSPPAWEALDTWAPQLVSNAFENHMVILVNMPFLSQQWGKETSNAPSEVTFGNGAQYQSWLPSARKPRVSKIAIDS